MKEYYEKYREQLQTVVDKSEDDFEKKLIYIAAGTLGLSFTFITDIIEIPNCSMIWILIIGWSLLVACILINLLSHISSKNKANKTIEDIDLFILDKNADYCSLKTKIDKRNQNTNKTNYITTAMVVLGIICVVLFTSYNLISSNNKSTENGNISKKEKTEFHQRNGARHSSTTDTIFDRNTRQSDTTKANQN